MADVLTIMAELGEDTDLLLAPDEWLENKRVALQQNMAIIAEQLNGVLTAQRIKQQLQQRNLVAVRCVDVHNDQPRDIVIKICPVADAIAKLEDDRHHPAIPSDVSDQNAQQQIDIWHADGYDVTAAKRLGKKKRQQRT